MLTFSILLNAVTIFGDSVVENLPANAGDVGSVSGSGKSPGEGIGYLLLHSWASLVAQLVKNLPAKQETWVQSLGWVPSQCVLLQGDITGADG